MLLHIYYLADSCSNGVVTGDGYGTQCDSLVTDGDCTQTCTAGYHKTGGTGVMTCLNGIFNGAEQITCTGDLLYTDVPNTNFRVPPHDLICVQRKYNTLRNMLQFNVSFYQLESVVS